MSLFPHLVLEYDDKGKPTKTVPLNECTPDQLYELKLQLNDRWTQSLAFNRGGGMMRKQIENMIAQVDERLENIAAAAQVREWRRERGEDIDDPETEDNLPSFVNEEDEDDFLIDD